MSTVKEFPFVGTWGALEQAEKWLFGNGYSFGHIRTPEGELMPAELIGVRLGKHQIGRLVEMSEADRSLLDGRIVPVVDFRTGGARIELFRSPTEMAGSNGQN